MATVLKTTFQLRRGLAEVWARNNPILAKGEPGFVLDENRLKIGDGVTAWNDLDYIGEAELEQYNELKQLIEELQQNINNYATKEEVLKLTADRFALSSAPKGTLMRVREDEIRIMCPKNYAYDFQNGGVNAQKNLYYIGVKVYAPNDSVYSFKEDMAEIISDTTMHYFENNSFAGIEPDGRKYSLMWLAVARYDESAQKWIYYGENSTHQKYLGWNYRVDWYDINGSVIASDSFRINLSNENCHNIIEPYYMGSINVNKLTQSEGDVLVLYGGSATDNI